MNEKEEQIREFLSNWGKSVLLVKGWDAQQWANKAGTTPTNVQRGLLGKKNTITLVNLIKLCQAANVPVPINELEEIIKNK